MSELLDTLKSVRKYRYFPNDWKEQAMSDAADEIERLLVFVRSIADGFDTDLPNVARTVLAAHAARMIGEDNG